ncbi:MULTISPECIES: nuclear transport factor 2 family protein [unclassified Streptomyces]|uniref:nuclear transport factor 2 family protein n=1 Tax=unclassified Streptomyces TaxID=2593676 RepID=UPI0011C90387|nr:nuclear transport factor 2 family protein [Streptomyces sp. wa22]TXS19694.1 nuclear transport factor 2 family protein [Streptomyces sp. wa22]WSQ82595.1 nuclear transport factor 2 family protein [Streptomyces sp. NBC_01213]
MSRADDRFEIQDVLFRYARAVDRLDYDAIAACYFDDAVDVHGGYTGDAAGLVEDIRARHRTIDSSQHFISNVLVEFTGEHSADVESYCLCFLRQAPAEPGGEQDLAIIRCRYVDRFERRDGSWGIADRVVVFDESRVIRMADGLAPDWVASRRDGTDPVYSWGHRSHA